MRALNVFPVTVYQDKIEHNDYLKRKLIPGIIDSLPELEIPDSWATDNLFTSFDGEPKGKEVVKKHEQLIKQECCNAINSFFDRPTVFEISDNVWYNYYTEGSYQELHDHIASPFNPFHFSCILYLSYDHRVHTPAEFRDPIAQLRPHSVIFDSDFVSEYFVPRVREGDLLMFPTYLQHRIIPQKVTDIPRITLSFNLKILRYG